jgi:hypothetical protein
MTIFHKSILSGACEIAKTEPDGCILLEPDGTVAAINQYSIYAAQPTSLKIISGLPFKGDSFLPAPVAVSVE